MFRLCARNFLSKGLGPVIQGAPTLSVRTLSDSLKSNQSSSPSVPVKTPPNSQVKGSDIIHVVDPEKELHVLFGIPEEHVYLRRVRIFKPSKNAMQSGTHNTRYWMTEFENRERWENPLMGWGSTGDPLSNLQIQFSSKEAAIEYCEKYQYPYYVEEPPPERKPRRKSYADNFSWDKRTRVGSK